MSGLPDDTPDLTGEIEEAKKAVQAAVRGDDAWRYPDMVDAEDINMAAPMPPEYVAAHMFMESLFGPNGYTPDAVGQLVDVFLPCLRIMCDTEGHPWGPNGELWRAAGVLNLTGDVDKKHERFQWRYWTNGDEHPDSGYDLINFVGFVLRSDPNSRFGRRGEPAPAPGSREE